MTQAGPTNRLESTLKSRVRHPSGSSRPESQKKNRVEYRVVEYDPRLYSSLIYIYVTPPTRMGYLEIAHFC